MNRHVKYVEKMNVVFFTGAMKFLKNALVFFSFRTKVEDSKIAPKRAIREKTIGIM